MTVFDMMTHFEKNPDVMKTPTKIILRNTVTRNKKALTDKTDIAVISAFITENLIVIELLASNIKVQSTKAFCTSPPYILYSSIY